jgi:hypothetical protein
MHERFFVRADERDAGVFAGLSQVRVFGQEAVAGVDGVDAVACGDLDDGWNVEIGADRLAAGADLVGLDRHRANPQLVGAAEDADGDFAAVGAE